MVSTELEILIASRSLIAHPDNWCRGVEARDAKGNEVAPEEEDAVARCAVGALGAITRWSELYPRAVSVLTSYLPCGFSSIIDFNDASTHSEVLALFDRAIAAQRAKAGSVNLIKGR